MCNEKDGFAEAAGEGAEFALEFTTSDGIEGAEWFVHKQNGRVGSEGAGDTDTLALPSGELTGIAGGKLGRIEAYETKEILDASCDPGCLPMLKARNESNILRNRKVGKQPGFLNDVSDAPSQTDRVGAGRRLAVNDHLARGR